MCRREAGELGSNAERSRWRSSIERYALPPICKTLVGNLQVQDMLRVLQAIWQDKTETATRVSARIEAILSWATVAGHRTGDNLARWRGNLDTLLPKPSVIADKDNHPPVALDDAALAIIDAMPRRVDSLSGFPPRLPVSCRT
ncbi:MAG: phage integrase central domain-containing protein [Paracoccus sp. (in: a-proteobacteria)]|uniref:phage integrase central domain-containing protein n=1 Tax=Paracoccus sp. TaxID=267 RepID=UPI004059EBED